MIILVFDFNRFRVRHSSLVLCFVAQSTRCCCEQLQVTRIHHPQPSIPTLNYSVYNHSMNIDGQVATVHSRFSFSNSFFPFVIHVLNCGTRFSNCKSFSFLVFDAFPLIRRFFMLFNLFYRKFSETDEAGVGKVTGVTVNSAEDDVDAECSYH